MNQQAYNFTVTQLETAKKSKTATGKDQVKFRAAVTIRGRETERTVIAQGASFDLVKDMVRKGKTLALRCVFDNVANDDGSKGGEFLKVVALPRAKAA